MYRPRILDWVFYAGVGLLYLTFVAIDDPFLAVALFAPAGALVAGGAGVGVLGRALARRDRASAALVGVALTVSLAAAVTWWPARCGLQYIAFRADRAALAVVARVVLAEPRMHRISAGDRYWKHINDTPVRDLGPPTPVGGEPAGPPEAVPAAEVLRRQGIAPAAYRAARAGLLRAGYLSVDVKPHYILFVEDGMLDNEYGVLLVRPGQLPPRVGPPVRDEDMYFTGMRPLGGGWFAWTST